MSATDLKNRIESLVSHILFEYEGLSCGIDPINAGCIDLWCGEDSVRCKSVEEAMTIPLFGGKSLSDICQTTAFEY